ncbi:hypothetical protein Cgig2_005457 [Carnegiea gigantea]|uniref:Uncharacterized protein n=1 Tax=Carnegiea gigantea TaxID=171969 RepID=A0A9Q1KB03_9CARY|nr:hypothetical protein Cgig2_005457 [Carnegiea gigantea]
MVRPTSLQSSLDGNSSSRATSDLTALELRLQRVNKKPDDDLEMTQTSLQERFRGPLGKMERMREKSILDDFKESRGSGDRLEVVMVWWRWMTEEWRSATEGRVVVVRRNDKVEESLDSYRKAFDAVYLYLTQEYHGEYSLEGLKETTPPVLVSVITARNYTK